MDQAGQGAEQIGERPHPIFAGRTDHRIASRGCATVVHPAAQAGRRRQHCRGGGASSGTHLAGGQGDRHGAGRGRSLRNGRGGRNARTGDAVGDFTHRHGFARKIRGKSHITANMLEWERIPERIGNGGWEGPNEGGAGRCRIDSRYWFVQRKNTELYSKVI